MQTDEFNDLKQIWQSINLAREDQDAFTSHQLQQNKRTSLRGGFRPLVIGQIVQIVCGLLIALVSGSFWFDHRNVPHLLITGLLLHGYGLMMIVFAVRNLVVIQRIDYSAPVLAIQRHLLALRAWRLQAAWWLGVAGCFIWIPLLLMFFYAGGIDLWVHQPMVVYLDIVSGLVCLSFFYGLVRWSRRPGQEKLARALQRSAVGQAVTRLQAEMEELSRFERE
ncbi:MAG: hypothetical protein M3Y80_01415 [Verrucomicrobiota bacterium]|nr:hypothetical protein [Verrucomicrobiota bacterium]